MLNETDEQQMYIQSLRNLTTLESDYGRLGKVRYSLTEHEKVTLMTFPFGNGILCRSLTPKANAGKIRDKVVQAIKKKPSKKK